MKYLLRKNDPYRKDEYWYYRENTSLCWTSRPEQATFLTKEEALNIGLSILEKTDIACEIIGPYV